MCCAERVRGRDSLASTIRAACSGGPVAACCLPFVVDGNVTGPPDWFVGSGDDVVWGEVAVPVGVPLGRECRVGGGHRVRSRGFASGTERAAFASCQLGDARLPGVVVGDRALPPGLLVCSERDVIWGEATVSGGVPL